MISYCDDCGEYLGDYVEGVLFKFGQRVVEPHLCPGQSCVVEPSELTLKKEDKNGQGIKERKRARFH